MFVPWSNKLENKISQPRLCFHWIGPLGRFSLLVVMFVICVSMCLCFFAFKCNLFWRSFSVLLYFGKKNLKNKNQTLKLARVAVHTLKYLCDSTCVLWFMYWPGLKKLIQIIFGKMSRQLNFFKSLKFWEKFFKFFPDYVYFSRIFKRKST